MTKQPAHHSILPVLPNNRPPETIESPGLPDRMILLLREVQETVRILCPEQLSVAIQEGGISAWRIKLTLLLVRYILRDLPTGSPSSWCVDTDAAERNRRLQLLEELRGIEFVGYIKDLFTILERGASEDVLCCFHGTRVFKTPMLLPEFPNGAIMLPGVTLKIDRAQAAVAVRITIIPSEQHSKNNGRLYRLDAYFSYKDQAYSPWEKI